MAISIQDARPPFVRFENRPVEDREASIAAGHLVHKDRVFALITPAGSKDVIEKIAEEWLANLETEVRAERFPSEWLKHFRGKFREFIETGTVKVDGIPISALPNVTPAQLKNLESSKIYSVEDLAQLTEEGIASLGMGGRELRDRAKAFMVTQKDGSAQVAVENSALKSRIGELEAEVKRLSTRLAAATAKAA